jgi:hypothetical protein
LGIVSCTNQGEWKWPQSGGLRTALAVVLVKDRELTRQPIGQDLAILKLIKQSGVVTVFVRVLPIAINQFEVGDDRAGEQEG